MSRFKLVEHFNQKVLGIEPREIDLQGRDEFELSLKQLREEIQEMEDKYNQGDIIGVVDGLIDLDYFHKGVLYKMGISEDLYDQLFSVVHLYNCRKKRGTNPHRQGHEAADAIKPEGWEGPEEQLNYLLVQEMLK